MVTPCLPPRLPPDESLLRFPSSSSQPIFQPSYSKICPSLESGHCHCCPRPECTTKKYAQRINDVFPSDRPSFKFLSNAISSSLSLVALDHVQLTSLPIYLSQRLKARSTVAHSLSGHHLSISVFMITSNGICNGTTQAPETWGGSETLPLPSTFRSLKETVAALQAFRERHADAQRIHIQLSLRPTTIDPTHHRPIPKNKAIIEAFGAEAVGVLVLCVVSQSSKEARQFEDLTASKVGEGYPRIIGAVETIIKTTHLKSRRNREDHDQDCASKTECDNNPTTILSFGPGTPPSSPRRPPRYPRTSSRKGRWMILAPSHRNPSSMPRRLPSRTFPPMESMSPATPRNNEGDAKKTVSSADPNTMQISSDNLPLHTTMFTLTRNIPHQRRHQARINAPRRKHRLRFRPIAHIVGTAVLIYPRFICHSSPSHRLGQSSTLLLDDVISLLMAPHCSEAGTAVGLLTTFTYILALAQLSDSTASNAPVLQRYSRPSFEGANNASSCAVLFSPPSMPPKVKTKSASMPPKVKTKSAAKPKAPRKQDAATGTAKSGGGGRRNTGWTTDPEYEFLKARIPKFLEHKQTRVVRPFLVAVADELVQEFPSRTEESKDEAKFIKRIRDWYGNHTRKTVRGSDQRGCLNITGAANRKPLRLQRAQAYSKLYYHEDSEVAKEVLLLYKQYKAGHPEVVSRFQPLFKKPKSDDAVDGDDPEADNAVDGDDPEADSEDPGICSNEGEDPKADDGNDLGADDNGNGDSDNDGDDDTGASNGKRVRPKIVPKYLPFQQAVIREKVKALSPEEDAALEKYIKEDYDAAMRVWESPWLASAKPGEDVDDLRKKYYRQNAERLCHTLQVAGDEIARQTGYRSFFLWGGPSTQMPGTVNVTAIETGVTLEGNQGFANFSGPLFTELEVKFRKWLELTYTKSQLEGTSPAVPANAEDSTLLSSVVASPIASSEPTVTPTGLSQQPAVTPTTVPPASNTMPTTDPTQIAVSPVVAPPSPVNVLSVIATPPSPTAVPPMTPTPPLQAAMLPTIPTPLFPTSEMTPRSPPDDNWDASEDITMALTSSAPPSRCVSPESQTPPPPTPPPTSPIPSPSTTVPVTGSLLSSLQGSLPRFITPEVIEHLNSITNVPGWSGLVENYLKFEAASPSRSTAHLPSQEWPDPVAVWMNNMGRLEYTISDTAAFARKWKEWWIKCQPTERPQGSWPFPRKPCSGLDWGKLLKGGKRGIFLFVISLSWWATSLGSSAFPPEIIEAIDDLNWVLCQLTTGLSPPPPPPSLTPPSTIADTILSKRKIKLTEKAAGGGEKVRKRYCRK